MTPLQLLLLCVIATQAAFAAVPGMDIAVSGLFYSASGGFWMAREPALVTLRMAGWNLGLAVFGLLIVMAAASWRMRLRTPASVWAYGIAAMLLGPALIVNGLFKEYWGRARPAQIIEFGGTAHFTPPMQIAGECARNCSFVSGEGALAFTLSFVLWRLLAPDLGARGRVALGFGLGAYVAVMAGLRVGFGGHFLSDTLFAALFCALICYGLARLPCFRQTATHAGLLSDAGTVTRALMQAPLRLLKRRSLPRAG